MNERNNNNNKNEQILKFNCGKLNKFYFLVKNFNFANGKKFYAVNSIEIEMVGILQRI